MNKSIIYLLKRVRGAIDKNVQRILNIFKNIALAFNIDFLSFLFSLINYLNIKKEKERIMLFFILLWNLVMQPCAAASELLINAVEGAPSKALSTVVAGDKESWGDWGYRYRYTIAGSFIVVASVYVFYRVYMGDSSDVSLFTRFFNVITFGGGVGGRGYRYKRSEQDPPRDPEDSHDTCVAGGSDKYRQEQATAQYSADDLEADAYKFESEAADALDAGEPCGKLVDALSLDKLNQVLNSDVISDIDFNNIKSAISLTYTASYQSKCLDMLIESKAYYDTFLIAMAYLNEAKEKAVLSDSEILKIKKCARYAYLTYKESEAACSNIPEALLLFLKIDEKYKNE